MSKVGHRLILQTEDMDKSADRDNEEIQFDDNSDISGTQREKNSCFKSDQLSVYHNHLNADTRSK